jgi:hypothetical protein
MTNPSAAVLETLQNACSQNADVLKPLIYIFIVNIYFYWLIAGYSRLLYGLFNNTLKIWCNQYISRMTQSQIEWKQYQNSTKPLVCMKTDINYLDYPNALQIDTYISLHYIDTYISLHYIRWFEARGDPISFIIIIDLFINPLKHFSYQYNKICS